MDRDDLIRKVQLDHAGGMSFAKIAEKYGISKSQAQKLSTKSSTKSSTKKGKSSTENRPQNRGRKRAREPDEKAAVLYDGKHDAEVLNLFLDQGLSQS